MTVLLVVALLQSANTGVSSIDGIVLKAGTVLQQPLPNARLELLGGPRGPVVTRTDGGGRFVFRDVVPGRYRLAVTRDGFLRQEYGPFTLTAGDHLSSLVFQLDAAPTIAGTVLDEDGFPVPDVMVTAARRTYDRLGRPTLTVVASAATDDRGAYRIFWIDRGSYYVSAGHPRTEINGTESSGFLGYAPVYFPGVTDPEGVKPIRADIGQEVNGVNFRLRRQTIPQIKVETVHAATQTPVTATITMSPLDDTNNARYRFQTNATRQTEAVASVAPGSYVLTATSESGEKLAGYSLARVLSVPRFFLNIRLVLNPTVQVVGQVFTQSGQMPDLRTSKLILTSVEPAGFSPNPVLLQADGSFSVKDVSPGEYLLDVDDLPEDSYVKAGEPTVRIRNDVGSALRIAIASDGGRIIAETRDRENHILNGAQVVLVPEDARGRSRPNQYRTGQSGLDGNVRLQSIPPGVYKLFAWESVEPNAYLNSDFLRMYESLAVPVTIRPGDNGAIAVRALPAE